MGLPFIFFVLINPSLRIFIGGVMRLSVNIWRLLCDNKCIFLNFASVYCFLCNKNSCS